MITFDEFCDASDACEDCRLYGVYTYSCKETFNSIIESGDEKRMAELGIEKYNMKMLNEKLDAIIKHLGIEL